MDVSTFLKIVCVRLVIAHDFSTNSAGSDTLLVHRGSSLFNSARSIHKRNSEVECQSKYSLKYDQSKVNSTVASRHEFEGNGSLYDAVRMAWTGPDPSSSDMQLIALTQSTDPQASLIRISSDHRNFHPVQIDPDLDVIMFERNPERSSHVIIMGILYGEDGKRDRRRSCVSDNGGVNFTCADLDHEASLRSSVQFKGDKVMAIFLVGQSTQYLCVSQNKGLTWTRVLQDVFAAQWHPNKTGIIYAQVANPSSTSFFFWVSPPSEYFLKKVEIFETTIRVEVLNGLKLKPIFGFQYVGSFIHVTAAPDDFDGHKLLMVSTDDGNTFNATHLPTVTQAQSINILDSTQGLIFAHISNRADETIGDLYTSGSDGILYSQSLERNIALDFTVVNSVLGVYLTTVKMNDESLQTMITHDRGGSWVPLRMRCDRQDPCGLQVYGSFLNQIHMKAKGALLSVSPMSHTNAPGILIIHGMRDEKIQFNASTGLYKYDEMPTVFVSGDGGRTWDETTLRGAHHILISDSGSVLQAFKIGSDMSSLKFSTNEGKCWLTLPLPNGPDDVSRNLSIKGMIAKPGAQSLSISLVGLATGTGTEKWFIIDVNFTSILSRKCTKTDLQPWTSKAQCYLGQIIKFNRIKLDSWCYLGEGTHIEEIENNKCYCKKSVDLQCDYGFVRNVEDDCVKDASWKDESVVYCLDNQQYQLESSGYRWIPGTSCTNTSETENLPSPRAKPLDKACDEGDASSFLTVQDVCAVHVPCTAATEQKTAAAAARGLKVAVALLTLVVVVCLVALVLLLRQNRRLRKRNDYSEMEEPTFGSVIAAQGNESDRIVNGRGTGNSYSRLKEEGMTDTPHDVDLLNL